MMSGMHLRDKVRERAGISGLGVRVELPAAAEGGGPRGTEGKAPARSAWRESEDTCALCVCCFTLQ